MQSKRGLAAALAFSLLIASGCSDDDSDDARDNQGGSATVSTTTPGDDAGNAPTSEPSSTTAGSSTGGGGSGAVASDDAAPFEVARLALVTASEAVSNGRPFDLDVDTRDGTAVFEVKVESGGSETQVIVDSSGTSVMSSQASSTPDDDIAKLDSAQLTAVDALDRAAELEPNARLEELEIDSDNGTVVWHLELKRSDGVEVELELHAGTGDVIEHEIGD